MSENTQRKIILIFMGIILVYMLSYLTTGNPQLPLTAKEDIVNLVVKHHLEVTVDDLVDEVVGQEYVLQLYELENQWVMVEAPKNALIDRYVLEESYAIDKTFPNNEFNTTFSTYKQFLSYTINLRDETIKVHQEDFTLGKYLSKNGSILLSFVLFPIVGYNVMKKRTT